MARAGFTEKQKTKKEKGKSRIRGNEREIKRKKKQRKEESTVRRERVGEGRSLRKGDFKGDLWVKSSNLISL